MKLSIISLAGIILASSDVAYGDANNCAQTLSTAQECVKQCVNTGSTNTDGDGVIYGNVLLECIDKAVEEGQAPFLNRAEQLENCCGMVEEGTCGKSLQNANSCLTTELTNIRTKSLSYLECIYNAKEDKTCVFANFCVNILTGGFDEGYTNDFKVGESDADNSLAVISRNAQTCGDMDVFGYNACNEVKGCCEPCQNLIAGVAHAVTYDLLLPAYNTAGTFSDCAEKSCDDYMNTTATTATTATPAGRQLETEDASTDATMSADNAAVVELAGECNDGLAQDIVVYNETFAVSNFFECLYKKMGKIVSETEQTAQGAEESSSVSFLFGATSMAVSAMASAVIAIVA